MVSEFGKQQQNCLLLQILGAASKCKYYADFQIHPMKGLIQNISIVIEKLTETAPRNTINKYWKQCP